MLAAIQYECPLYNYLLTFSSNFIKQDGEKEDEKIEDGKGIDEVLSIVGDFGLFQRIFCFYSFSHAITNPYDVCQFLHFDTDMEMRDKQFHVYLEWNLHGGWLTTMSVTENIADICPKQRFLINHEF